MVKIYLAIDSISYKMALHSFSNIIITSNYIKFGFIIESSINVHGVKPIDMAQHYMSLGMF